MNNKTITTILFAFAMIWVVDSTQISYADEDTTETEKRQSMYDDMITLQKAEKDTDQSMGLLEEVSSPSDFINFVLVSDIDNEVVIGIDEGASYSGTLSDFKAELQETYGTDINIVVGTTTVSWNTCSSLTDFECDPQFGGMRVFIHDIISNTIEKATIFLAVENDDGDKGFIINGHATNFNDDNLASSNVLETVNNFGLSPSTWSLSGTTHGNVTNVPYVNSDGTEYLCDCAFVNFTQTDTTYNTDGSVNVEAYQNETVQKYTIFNSTTSVFTVTGVKTISEGDILNATGAMSGHQNYEVSSTRQSLLVDKDNDLSLTGITHKIESELIFGIWPTFYPFFEDGDSGAPLYTNPDSDGNTKIVGMHSATVEVKDEGTGDDVQYHLAVPWETIASELDLVNPS